MVESPLSIACEDLEAAMVWLVQLLGMELTALLGPTVTTHAHIQAALNRLRGAGAVVSVSVEWLKISHRDQATRACHCSWNNDALLACVLEIVQHKPMKSVKI